MIIEKVYNSCYFHYMTYVMVRGEARIIEFKGGINYGNYQQQGTFATSETELQEAIECDPRFGKEIFLLSPLPQMGNPEASLATEVMEVTNLQQAKEWLMQQGVTPQRLSTPEAIARQAKAKGVVFPNLERP